MLLFVFLSLSTVGIFAENCDKLGILLYEDIGCKPNPSTSLCPKSYKCTLTAPKDECLVRGATYPLDSKIADNPNRLSCKFGCFCTKRNNVLQASCAEFGCQNWGQEPKPGCHWTFKSNACCASGEDCQHQEEVCEYAGAKYKIGERFVATDSCYTCTCMKGFRGKIEAPFCLRNACDVQVRKQMAVRDFCAPFYYRKSGNDKICCPDDWICGNGKDVEVQYGGTKSGETCRFANQTLNVGDSFPKTFFLLNSTVRIKCKCNIPPLVSCFIE